MNSASVRQNCASPSITWVMVSLCSTTSSASQHGTETSSALSICPVLYSRRGHGMQITFVYYSSEATLGRRASKLNSAGESKTQIRSCVSNGCDQTGG